MRGYDDGQFRGFDGKDNRKTVLSLFTRLGHGLPERVAGMKRAGFLQAIIHLSTDFQGRPLIADPCSATEAYFLFVAICGCLGVKIEAAAGLLEEVVAHGERQGREKLREQIALMGLK